jgi:hypothetical protein
MAPRIVASGLRSSWDASAVKRFIASKDASSRAIIWLNVSTSRPISSCTFGAGRRRLSRLASISRAARVTSSTGASARPASQ